MPLQFDAESAAARDYAKRCVPEGGKLSISLLLRSLYHTTDLKEQIPELGRFLERPTEFGDETPGPIPLSQELVRPISSLAEEANGPVTPEDLFLKLLWSPAGMNFASQEGVPDQVLNSALAVLRGERPDVPVASPDHATKGEASGRFGWRATMAREEALQDLNAFGRMLTEGTPPKEAFIGMDDEIQAVFRALVKRKQRSALVIGLPGTGKTALVREVARRLLVGDPSVPRRLRDYDIFELSTTFLRAGTSLVGQYEERISKLLGTLEKSPKIILFVDEVHAFLKSGMHETGNFTEATEAFKQALAEGSISLIGATTTAEYRHYLAPDAAWVQRFSLIKLNPPNPEETLAIIEGRLPEIETFYDVDIPEAILPRIVDLTEEYLPTRAQPRKSIQFLDEACAYCVTRKPPLTEVTETALWEALEDTIGHAVMKEETLTEEGLFERLSAKIIGQDEALRGISRAFVSGLGGWTVDRESPRGVFFFGGPTGVGKTATALLLAEELGAGREAVVRVDCNMLQGSGADSGPALHVLLGPPPGYIGYVRGKGGVLSRIREFPESIVLFDEIEKADPGVGEVLLQILDSGRCEDNDGNLLDFRRSFIIFTSNAGVRYEVEKHHGFQKQAALGRPTVDPERVKDRIRKMGLGEEFLGRISHYFMFRGLGEEAVSEILLDQMEELRDTAEVRGYELIWEPEVLPHLANQWQPRFGVRHLVSILRNRIVEHLSVADAQGELDGITRIKLRVVGEPPGIKTDDPAQQATVAVVMAGNAIQEREGDTLNIGLT